MHVTKRPQIQQLQRKDAPAQYLILSSAKLHRDESHNNVVKYGHPGGCHLEVRLRPFLEWAGQTESSDQSLVRIIDNQPPLWSAFHEMSALIQR